MKKTLIVLLTAIIAVSLFVACSPETETKHYTVTFDVEGNTATIAPKSVTAGSKVEEPTVKPTKTGKIFDYWATEKDGTVKFDFANTAITADTTLYAVFRNYRIGDTISYGSYPGNYGIESLQNQPITWKVIHIDTAASKALVISENVLKNTTWGSSDSYNASDIRQYLTNSYSSGFISTYGLSDVSKLCAVNCSGEKTTFSENGDLVFLLSATEVNDYLTGSKIAYLDGSATAWWLRTYDSDSGSPKCVNASGEVENGGSSSHEYGARPALWVSFGN